jgi:transcriptional regulator with XRE-family HTH domain
MQNTLTDATRRLRLALGDTQQQFAQRTGLAISTVVRYELSRPPHGKALAQFAVLAERNGLHDVARTFAYAAGNAPETAPMHAAMDSLWFNRENLAGWPMLAHHLCTELESLVELKRKQPDSVDEKLEDLETQLIHLRSVLFGTAPDQVNEAAAKIAAEDPTLTWGKAYERALKENPELYARYLQERADAARGTSSESSLAVHGTRQQAARKRSGKGRKTT